MLEAESVRGMNSEGSCVTSGPEPVKKQKLEKNDFSIQVSHLVKQKHIPVDKVIIIKAGNR